MVIHTVIGVWFCIGATKWTRNSFETTEKNTSDIEKNASEIDTAAQQIQFLRKDAARRYENHKLIWKNVQRHYAKVSRRVRELEKASEERVIDID